MRKQTKKALNLANILENGKPQAGDVLISSFLPSTGGQGSEQRRLNSRAEGQDSLGQAAMCDYSNKSNREQVKDTVPTWSQNWLFLNILRCRVYSGPPTALPLPQRQAPLTHSLSLDLPVRDVYYKCNHVVCEYSGLYVGVPLKMHMLKPNPQGDGVRRGALRR